MKKLFLVFALACFASLLYGQTTTVTNNNTIIIQGNVYYFQPSNTPSSPQPTVRGSNFINPGSWYGADAAKAWASISNWVIERCRYASNPIIADRGERVYISQVHAYRGKSPEAYKYAPGYPMDIKTYDGVSVYYWRVKDGDLMENGRRAIRYFYF
jgi:hypothetical protein